MEDLNKVIEAIKIIKLDPNATHLIVYNPKSINPDWIREAFENPEFEGLKAVAISVYDINDIKVFNLK